MIHEFLYAWAKTQTAITDLIGSGDAIRWWPMNAPENQETYPKVTYLKISDIAMHDFDGRSGVNRALIQIDCWARGSGGYASVNSLAEAIHGTIDSPALDGYRGTTASVEVQRAEMVLKSEENEVPGDASDEWIYRIMMHFTFIYQE